MYRIFEDYEIIYHVLFLYVWNLGQLQNNISCFILFNFIYIEFLKYMR